MKKILITSGGFYPGFKFGGPVRSICNLIDNLNDSYDFNVVSSDRDLSDVKPYKNIKVDQWSNSYKGNDVYYSSPGLFSLLKLALSLKGSHFDIVYLNSYFSIKYSQFIILLTRIGLFTCDQIIVAPRGELTMGAMSLKGLKKRIFLRLIKITGFNVNIKFQFTSKQECEESLKFLGNVNHIEVPNMHAQFPPYRKKKKEKGELRVIFLSRISEKKNLHTFLQSLSNIECEKLTLTIAGVVEDENYWQRCEDILSTFSSRIHVRLLGSVDRDEVAGELENSHLFVLPTLNENYGHAIVEAMMYSNTVLLSDQTPWNKVSRNGGFVVGAYDTEGYKNAVESVISMNTEVFNYHTLRTYNYCNDILNINELKIKNLFE
ncbi:glycosyltransferase family 4 protein [Vibrio breoganii]